MGEQPGNGRGKKKGGYGRKGTKAIGAKRSAGRSATSSGRSSHDAASLIKIVSEAEVTALEAHPKYSSMYRVAIQLYGEHSSEDEVTPHVPQSDKSINEPADWNEEVDAFLAGAGDTSTGGEASTVITVHEDTLVSLRLLKGRRLSSEEWEMLRQEEDREDAYRSALAILERKARTRRELSEALKRKGYAPDIIASCLDRLQERRMLDDSSYAKRFAEQRVTGQRKGRRLIRQELLQRGVTKEDADKALGELDANAEREAALNLARKKWPQLKGEPRERKHKLAAFLLRRGYPNGIVKEAVDHAAAADSADAGWDADLDAGDVYESGSEWDGTDPQSF